MNKVETPRLYDHTVALYEALDKGATMKGKTKVWYGSMVTAFRSINVSQGYYSKLYNLLKELGCIEVVVAGRGGQRQSEIVLIQPPELDGFTRVYEAGLTNSKPHDILSQRVSVIEGRLGSVDIGSALVNHNERLEFLEEQLATLIREVQSLGPKKKQTNT